MNILEKVISVVSIRIIHRAFPAICERIHPTTSGLKRDKSVSAIEKPEGQEAIVRKSL